MIISLLQKMCLRGYDLTIGLHHNTHGLSRSPSVVCKPQIEFGRVLFKACIMERWATLPCGDYAVSDHGRVKRVTEGDGTWPGRILAPSTGKLGYPRVMLCKNGKMKTLLIYQAVALHFIGPRPQGMVVDHVDET